MKDRRIRNIWRQGVVVMVYPRVSEWQAESRAATRIKEIMEDIKQEELVGRK